MSRTTTLRTTATMARMTGKDNNDSKDDNSKDDGDDGEDNNNDDGNNNSGGSGGGEIGGEVSGVARSVAWLVAVFFAVGCLAFTYNTVGILQIHLEINLFWYKFYSACPDMPNRIYFIRTYRIDWGLSTTGV
jgi:hypothetical protein